MATLISARQTQTKAAKSASNLAELASEQLVRSQDYARASEKGDLLELAILAGACGH